MDTTKRQSRTLKPRSRPRSQKKGESMWSRSPSQREDLPVIPGYFIVEHSDNKTFPVNSNCICKLIYEYIRVKVGIPDDMEFDLIDEAGIPVNLFDKEEGAFAYNYLLHKRKYYIFLLERTDKGALFNPRLMLNSNDPNFQRLMNVLVKIFGRQSVVGEKKKKRPSNRDPPPFHKHHKVIF